MSNIRIVADSSANILTLDTVPFAAAPLKILAADREFVDDETLDVSGMTGWFDTYKGKSKTSCPNTGDWLNAFADASEIFCVTITSGLSGSYNAACVAGQMYEAEHPDRRVHVVDSLSAGPEVALMVEKLAELVNAGLSFDEIRHTITAYTKKTGLLFMLESLKNFANNGRVSPAVAKIAGLLGIRIVGKASDEGTLEPLDKCRGEGKALCAILTRLEQSGVREGRILIHHSSNPAAADAMAALVREKFPLARVQIGTCRGLCSYYAEKGGLLVGFEKF